MMVGLLVMILRPMMYLGLVSLEDLKAVKWGIGVDNVDFSACKKLSIPITNTPGMFGAEVADLAMCYILGLARDAFYIDREVRNGSWPKPSGISLNNKILGIVGLGDIGLNIAKRAQAHGLKIIGWDPFIKEAPEYIDLHRNFPDETKRCDFIVFACSLTDDTYHLLSDDTLSFLKRGVRIVNVSRGQLIKESALLKGLKNNIINSAALDVFENEPVSNENDILKHPKCIVGSHNGSNTIEAVNRASNEAINILYNMLTLGGNNMTKAIVLTGSTGGIGKALASKYLNDNFFVIGLDSIKPKKKNYRFLSELI